MASNETVLLKSTLEIQNKAYTVKLTATEIYWEVATSARAAGGPYSEPLVSQHAILQPPSHPANPEEVVSKQPSSSVSTDTESDEPVAPGNEGAPLLRQQEPAPAVAPASLSLLRLMLCDCCPLCKAENQTVKLCEVIAVRLGDGRYGSGGGASPSNTQGTKFQNLEMVSLNPTAFSLWVVRRGSHHKWRERKVTFQSRDTSVIQQWVDRLQDTLAKPELGRPHSLLVFINPVGGKGRATRVYRDKVAPLFELAGISTDIITTQRQNHARDTLHDYDLSKVDGIVSIGGDGMFTEIVHGLMTRTLRENGIDRPQPDTPLPQPKLRIGIIPAGSTDTVAWTTLGTKDVTTAALHILIGDNTSMDLATCFHGNQFVKYNVSMMAYGYYGDCIVGSERNRWMGPKRYDWEGLKKVLGNRTYEGEISFLPSSDSESHPRDGTFCKAGCHVCGSIQPLDTETGANGTAGTSGEGSLYTVPLSSDKGWQKVKGRFIAINNFLISCRCHFAPEGPAPAAHLGDGCSDLVLVHECSRLDYTKHLVRCMDKEKDQFDFPFIHVYRVREFKFRPITEDIEDSHEASKVGLEGQQRLRSRASTNSVWNCDGEVVEEPNVDYKIHRQVLRLFARGIEDEIKEASDGCLNCQCMGRN